MHVKSLQPCWSERCLELSYEFVSVGKCNWINRYTGGLTSRFMSR